MRHRALLSIAFFVVAMGVTMCAWPYGIETHETINEEAATRSSLSVYLDTVLRLPEGIDTVLNGRDVLTWIRLGGSLEDNLPRPANHFHYPLRRWDQAKLTDFPGSRAATQSSVLWAQNSNQGNQDDTWSWVRARREFFDGLTLSDAAEREVALGRTFRALGQVLHLVADGSVPAHVRNDSHVSGEPLETWLDAKARRRGSETQEQARERFVATFAPNSVAFSPTILATTPNPLATIPIAKIFDADVYDGNAATLGLTTGDTVGITEFSNVNFFSADTVFADTFIGLERFSPFPSRTAVEQFIDPVNNRRYWRKTGPGLPVQHLATVSRLDFFRSGRPPLTGGLDPVVHEEYARLLTPRAVGYSAGLIDYFFRGRLAAVDPEFTETSVALKVTNAIDPVQSPAWANEKLFSHDNQLKPGRFVLTVMYKRGEKEQFAASDPVALEKAETLDPGQTSTQILSFDMPALPGDAADVKYRLVFRGRLGAEDDAIAVGIVEPVSGFIVNPNYVPVDGISGSRLIVKAKGKWQLTTQRNLQARHIDWKGGYVRGHPTKVLTYSGPVARYFPEPLSNTFGSNIYQGGELFARTFCPILGAAITKDTAGKEWLIAVCKEGLDDVVYRRENVKDTSSSGWEEIGRISVQPGASEADVPWFFNGNGTEAQTMRLRPRTIDGVFMPAWRDRYKLTITNTTSVQFENLENEFGVRTETRDQACIVSVIRSTGTQHETQHADVRSVVAVDYVDGNEVLGYWRLNISSDSSNEVNDGSQLLVEKADTNTKQSLVWRTNEIVLNEFVTLTDNFRVGFSFPGIEGQVLTQRKQQFGWVIYWDMRADLLIYFVDIHQIILDSGGVVAGGGAVRNEIIDTEEYTFWHKGETETVYENVNTTEFVKPGGCCSGTSVCTFPPFDSGSFTTIVTVHPGAPASDSRYHVAGIFGRRFSAAADSGGNAIVSMTYADKDDVRRWFNSLTGGDPTDIISGAPSEPRFWPVYVAK